MPTIKTCGAPHVATEFLYDGSVKEGAVIQFESGNVSLSVEFFRAILNKFRGSTIRGGFKMDDPPANGFGKWVQDNSALLNGRHLTPRHASFIAAILRNERYLKCRLDRNAIILEFNS